MSQNNPKLHAALVIACLALALSVVAAVRGPSGARATGSPACIDPEAREQLAILRRELAERDAVIGRLARAANLPGNPSSVPGNPSNVAGGTSNAGEPSPARETPPETGRRRYARFDAPNPAVSVSQNADGTYDIRTTDPSLAGSVMQITAVTASGQEDKVFLRIPQ